MNQAGWRPSASLDAIAERARLLSAIRGFFHRVGVMEVETPVCSAHGATDPALHSLVCHYSGPGASSGIPLYLATSPEFPMKRLLAAGSGPIYQLCRVFRDGESGRLHNPEFTLLEWYRPGFDHHQLMGEVAQLIGALTKEHYPVERVSYSELFRNHLGIDPHLTGTEQLQSCAESFEIPGIDGLVLDCDGWRDLLLTHRIEPELGRGKLTFVYDYPASQASLARIRGSDPPLAERFELYMNGVEIANGFHELSDPHEQQRRFTYDLVRRRSDALPEVPMDQHLLQALAFGLPDCAGVAVGVDRLLMQLLGADHIEQVLAFPLGRA